MNSVHSASCQTKYTVSLPIDGVAFFRPFKAKRSQILYMYILFISIVKIASSNIKLIENHIGEGRMNFRITYTTR